MTSLQPAYTKVSDPLACMLASMERREAMLCYRRMTELMHRLPADKLVDLIRAAAGDSALSSSYAVDPIFKACDMLDAERREEHDRGHGESVR